MSESNENNYYPSIETVFVRDAITKRLCFGALREMENHWIKRWKVTEKIDGMNIRVVVTLAGVSIGGRTDNATIHPDLISHITGLFSHETLVKFFTVYRGKDLPPKWSVTFFGEGYGAGIQKGGAYSATKRFRCFDIRLGEHLWINDAEVRHICGDLKIPTVPLLDEIDYIPSTKEALSLIIPESLVAKEDSGASGVLPEGIVARPPTVFFNAKRERVMWKLTFREFR